MLLVWMAAVLAAQGADAPAGTPLRGQYVTIGWSPLRCELEITDTARYLLRCGGRRLVEGPVGRLGSKVFLLPGSGSARLEETWEYRAAADVHINQQLAEHRFHPVVVPPPDDDGRSGFPCVMATVSWDHHLFLVDTFDRVEFCAVVASGRLPPAGKGRHLTFRSRDQKDGGVPVREFCREAWKPRLR